MYKLKCIIQIKVWYHISSFVSALYLVPSTVLIVILSVLPQMRVCTDHFNIRDWVFYLYISHRIWKTAEEEEN